MPWHTLTQPSICNRCRRELLADTTVWQGRYATYCAGCAATVGLDGGPGLTRAVEAMGGLDKRKLAAFAPEFTAAMRRLKAKAGRPERSWTGED